MVISHSIRLCPDGILRDVRNLGCYPYSLDWLVPACAAARWPLGICPDLSNNRVHLRYRDKKRRSLGVSSHRGGGNELDMQSILLKAELLAHPRGAWASPGLCKEQFGTVCGGFQSNLVTSATEFHLITCCWKPSPGQ